MSLDKNKQQSLSHSLPLPLFLSLSPHSPCVPLHILLPRRNGFTSDANRFSHDPVEYVDLLLSALVCEVR